MTFNETNAMLKDFRHRHEWFYILYLRFYSFKIWFSNFLSFVDRFFFANIFHSFVMKAGLEDETATDEIVAGNH